MARKSTSAHKRGSVRWIGYARVSTEEQATDGLSLDAQRMRIEAWATAAGVQLVGVEVDAGVSGSLSAAKRPALSRAIAALRDGRAAGLVVLRIDRLGRSMMGTLDLLMTGRKQGWAFASVTENVDTGTPTGQLMLHILTAFAEFERTQASVRTREGLAERRRRGLPTGGRVAFGWRVEGLEGVTTLTKGQGGVLVPYEPEARLLREMRALHADGLGAHRIAGAMNAKGRGNPRTGQPWTTGTVASIFRTLARRQGSP